MSKKIDDNGDLAASEAEQSADANSMDFGSDGSDVPSSEDIMDELGLSPADSEPPADEPEDTETFDDPSTDLTNESEEDDLAGEDENDGQDEDDSDSEDDQDDAAKATDATQARIDELTRKNKESDERLEATERKLQEAEQRLAAAQAEPANVGSFGTIDSLKDLAAKREMLVKNKQYLIQNLDGFTAKVGGEDKEYSAEEARELLADVEQKLDVDLPQRAQFLQQREPMVKEAQASYPDMFKRGTYLSQFYEAALKTLPGLSQMPNSHLVAGDNAVGMAVRSGKFKLVPVTDEKAPPAKKPAQPRKRARAASAAPKRSTAPKHSEKQARQSAASQRVSDGNGDVDDIAALIEDTVLSD